MEPMRVTQGLLDARVTLQRLHDARIVRGWIIGVDGSVLTVRAMDTQALELGEQFAARTARLNGDVAFLTVLRGAATVSAEDGLRVAAQSDRPTLLDFGERTYTFEVMGQMFPMPPSGDPRYVCEPSRVVVGGAEAELRDVSPSGLGVVTLARHEVGDQLEVFVEGPDGPERPVKVLAEVRYSRRLATYPPLYRVGLHVLSADRIERARWLVVVRERSRPRNRSRFVDDPPPAVEPMPLPRPAETGIEWVFRAPDPVITPEPIDTPVTVYEPELWEGR
jgi:hypothetical protein